MSKRCPDCGRSYSDLGTHWRYNSSHRYELSEEQEEVITGLLMGDATLQRNTKNAYPVVIMTNREFLEWVDRKFGCMTTGIRKHLTEEQSAENAKRLNPNASEKNYSSQYKLRFRAHPDFNKYRSWYTQDGKRWPLNRQYSYLTFKVLYCCDGSFDNSGTSRELQLAASNELSDKQRLSSIIGIFGLPEPNRMDEELVVWGAKESSEIFESMGKPLPGFEYKWPKEYRKG
jgi:hypothetical protein